MQLIRNNILFFIRPKKRNVSSETQITLFTHQSWSELTFKPCKTKMLGDSSAFRPEIF